MNTNTFDDLVPVTISGDTDIHAIVPIADQLGLYVTGAGTLDVTMASGNRRQQDVDAKTNFDGRVKTIHASGTTATGIKVKARGF